MGPVAYRLKLPPESKIHSVFHVSLLKAYVGPPPDEIPVLPEPPSQPIPHPAAILDRRWREEQGNLTLEVLIEWEGQPREDASWVSWDTILTLFPDYDLEGKVLLGPGGDVMTPNGEMGQDVDEAHIDETPTEGGGNKRVRSRPIWAEDYEM